MLKKLTPVRDTFSMLYTPDFGKEQCRTFERVEHHELTVGMKIAMLFYPLGNGQERYECWREQRPSRHKNKRITDNFEHFLPHYLATGRPNGASHGLYALIVGIDKERKQLHVTGVKDSWQLNFPASGV